MSFEKFKKLLRRKISIYHIILAFLLIFVAPFVIIKLIYKKISTAAENKIYYSAKEIPYCKVGLVLGCSPNAFLGSRIKAAAELFNNNKVDYLLVSGDNGRKDYDEPTVMKNALMNSGVPEDRIVCDYAGFRTLDSIIRAKEIFQLEKLIVISQKFHVERALYIADHKGIEATGYCADDVPGYMERMLAREHLSRAMAVFDILVNRQPKFLGEKIQIGNSQK